MSIRLSSAEIKLLRSLGTKKGRQENGLFIVEGEKLVDEALGSDLEVVRTYSKDEIGEDQMGRITLLDSPSPVLAVVKIPEWPLPGTPSGLSLALDGVRDPGNMGTILRICDWFGIDNIYASEDSVDVFNPKVVQSSMGAIFRKRLYYCDIPALCRDSRKSGLKVYGTLLDGRNIYTSELSDEGLIVMGNESKGISPEVRKEIDSGLLIPSYATGRGAESLNVAIATAVTVAEFKRRKW